ncbi:acyl carrier protein [Nocardia sp. NPDC049149]|uniref:acyl carrier protein n=1 Tax=Nocardia sp. NPDC049149 TaxID=3364315 RepID=UPI003722387A
MTETTASGAPATGSFCWAPIEKSAFERANANLADYAQTCHGFSWDADTLSRADAESAVRSALRGFAPDADLADLSTDEPLRVTLDLDSLDFLTFVERLTRATGVRIDEADYPTLATISTCVDFVTAAS